MIKISPSILACDFTRLGEEAKAMEAAGADMLHLDVMDGHFVNNISFGTPVIADLRKVTNLFFDTHLMLERPRRYIEHYVKAGSNRITFHIECGDDIKKTLNTIRGFGVESGLAVSPYTPLEKVLPFIDQVEQVLLMTVEPGYGGQPFIEHVRSKIADLRNIKKEKGYTFDIQVDGGITLETAPQTTARGATILVAGSALFSQPDYTTAVADLRAAGQKGADNPF